MTAKRKPVVLAVTSDHHCGSTLGLCPPEKVRLDDSGFYEASKAQKALWHCWEDFWKRVAALRKRANASLIVVYNGDLFDGDHHNTSQIISRNPEPTAYVADRVLGKLSPVWALKPQRVFVVRGTEVHVGQSGSSEEAFARAIGAERDPEGDTWSWWRLPLEVHGVLFDFQHHGRMGTRPWTEQSGVTNLAAHIVFEHARLGWRVPAVAVRSHRHVFGDSGTGMPTRVIATPGWQGKTAFTHRVVPEAIQQYGGVIVTVSPDATYDLTSVLYPEVERACLQ